MIPWRSLMPEQSVEDEYMTTQRKTDGLVLVTSLIDRLPNVGGMYESLSEVWKCIYLCAMRQTNQNTGTVN